MKFEIQFGATINLECTNEKAHSADVCAEMVVVGDNIDDESDLKESVEVKVWLTESDLARLIAVANKVLVDIMNTKERNLPHSHGGHWEGE